MENLQGSCSYFSGKFVMSVLDLLPCIDTNIWNLLDCQHHHGTGLLKTGHLHMKRGQGWLKRRLERLNLFIWMIVCLCWLKEFRELWVCVF